MCSATSRKCLLAVFGILLTFVFDTAEPRKGPRFVNTLSEAEQNVGETCLAWFPFNCDANYKYRKMNGECTNLDVPSRGKSVTACSRLLPALYKDGISISRTQSNGKELNSARVMSNIFCTELPESNPNVKDKTFTLSMMQWGQIVAHDMVGTSSKDGPACCTDKNTRLKDTTDNCVGIKVPTGDRFYSKFNKTCIDMPRTKSTKDINCPNLHPILPVNFVTAYLDASLLYGSTDETSNQLRTFNNGLLKSQMINNQMFPPTINEPQTVCRVSSNQDLCIQAGDGRANTHPMLAVMQTIFLRFHNMIGAKLFEINKSWNDEKLFQETRKFVIAVIQFITFNEFVPNLLGEEYLKKIDCCLVKKDGYNNIYDKTVNPQMLTEFISAAFRFLHSMIVNKVELHNDDRVPVSEWQFSDFYKAINFITNGENFKNTVIGLTVQPPATLDRHFVTSITDLLFQVNGVGSDMESLDIEKGRDMGVNTFPNYLAMLGNNPVKSWEDLSQYISSKMIDRLKTRYDSYEDVELFIGGMLENPVKGTAGLGSVFQAIIGEQFCRVQTGDRYYFELGDQQHSFKPEQLKQIRKITLAFLYCYTTNNLKTMQSDAFRQIDSKNVVKSCKEIIGDFTLNPWKE